MDRIDVQLILLADAPESLVEVCGITLLERLLRIAQRLGFSRVLVISTTPEAIRGEIARPSWARDKIWADIAPRPPGTVTVEAIREKLLEESARALVVPANVYCDARLLRALLDQGTDAALVDSETPAHIGGFLATSSSGRRLCGPAIVSTSLLQSLEPSAPFPDQIHNAVRDGRLAIIDAATEPSYIASMRRHVRPHCLPVRLEERREVEKIVLDAAQNGTLDLPAYVHAPIETAIVSLLCKTSLSPNQITIFGFVFGLSATFLFATGRVGTAIVLALIFGVLDGLDGKQARVKVETTSRGKWEHNLDLIVEYSWWIALAIRFQTNNQLPNGFFYLALFLGSDVIDRLAKRQSKLLTGRQLDDVLPFDRFFRLLSGRRNVYVWILAAGFLVGRGPDAYRLIALWAAVSAAIHVGRAISIWRGDRASA